MGISNENIMTKQMENNGKKDIFLCYRHKFNAGSQDNYELNNLFPDYIYEVLCRKYSVYYDSHSPAKGITEKSIEKIIDECTDFLIIVEEHSFANINNDEDGIDYYTYEFSYAWEKRKNIIPILKDWNVLSKLETRSDLVEIITKFKRLTPFIVRDTTGMGANADFIRLSLKNYLCTKEENNHSLSKNQKWVLVLTLAIPIIVALGIVISKWVDSEIINLIIIVCSSLAAYKTIRWKSDDL